MNSHEVLLFRGLKVPIYVVEGPTSPFHNKGKGYDFSRKE